MLLSIAEIWVFKNHFCIHVNGDVNFDKLVHENMFYSVITCFPKSGHILLYTTAVHGWKLSWCKCLSVAGHTSCCPEHDRQYLLIQNKTLLPLAGSLITYVPCHAPASIALTCSTTKVISVDNLRLKYNNPTNGNVCDMGGINLSLS